MFGAASSVLAVTLLGGCAWGPSSADHAAADHVATALDEAASGVAVATVVVELVGQGRTTTPVADVTLRDAIADVAGAQRTVADIVPTRDVAALRADAVQAVADALVAVADARAWVDGTSSDDETGVAQALDDAARTIDAVGRDLGG